MLPGPDLLAVCRGWRTLRLENCAGRFCPDTEIKDIKDTIAEVAACLAFPVDTLLMEGSPRRLQG